jgi:regulator of protease activity HflC (stomatin/prohibitin superfamily)
VESNVEWLKQLLQLITDLIPRIWLVNPDESGVRVTLGSRIRPTPPGWWLYWPVVQLCQKLTTVIQVVDLREQGLTTVDGVSLAISGAVEYTIRDAVKAILQVTDVDKNLPTLCLGKIAEYVERNTYADCTSEKIKAELRKEIREHVNAWGVAVKHIYVTDRIEAKALKIMLNATTAPITMIREISE